VVCLLGAGSGSALQGGNPGTAGDSGGGGGGGGGYWGGGAGYNGDSPAGNSGAGGGSGYYNSSYVSSAVLTAGSGTTPGDSSNPLRSSAGEGGTVGQNGGSGIVIVSYTVPPGGAPQNSLTLTGSLTVNSGSLNASNTALYLTGTNQTLSVNATTTFGTLTKIDTASSTLTFNTIAPIIITSTTTLQGTATSTLKLRSTTPDTQWFFDPQGGRDFAYLDVQDSNNINVTAIEATDPALFLSSGNNTNWEFTLPVLLVSKQGHQISTTTIPASDIDLGGAFTFSKEGETATISSIVLHQNGTLSADTYITNLKLYYQTATTCEATKPIDATSFGTGSTFVNNLSTTTGSMSVGTDNVCLYVTYDLEGELTEALAGHTIDLELDNPTTDIVTSSGTIYPSTSVNIPKNTIIYNPLMSDLISIHMRDPARNPTVFYLKDQIVWKREGTNPAYNLTNPNAKVTDLTFTDLTPSHGSNGVVRIQVTVSNVDVGAPPSFLNVTRSAGTVAAVRAWWGD